MKYVQVIPPFVDVKEIEEGEINSIAELFTKDFVTRHLEVDPSVILSFSLGQLPNPSEYEVVRTIRIEYPNFPAMSHTIGKLWMSALERGQHAGYLESHHPLLMQKVYGTTNNKNKAASKKVK